MDAPQMVLFYRENNLILFGKINTVGSDFFSIIGTCRTKQGQDIPYEVYLSCKETATKNMRTGNFVLVLCQFKNDTDQEKYKQGILPKIFRHVTHYYNGVIKMPKTDFGEEYNIFLGTVKTSEMVMGTTWSKTILAYTFARKHVEHVLGQENATETFLPGQRIICITGPQKSGGGYIIKSSFIVT